jgi:hypothetical protein
VKRSVAALVLLLAALLGVTDAHASVVCDGTLHDVPHWRSLTGQMRDVSMISATNGWAVRTIGTNGTTTGTRSTAARWNGVRWRRVNLYHPPEILATGVYAARQDAVWAVGYHYDATSGGDAGAQIQRWNGRVWRPISLPVLDGPSVLLDAVDGTSASDVWAVGSRFGDETLIVHWDGASWQRVPAPSPPEDPQLSIELQSVFAASPRQAWAVGTYFENDSMRSLVMRWDGTAWSILHDAAIDPAADPDSVGGSGPDDVWIVGAGAGLQRDTLAAHWDGTSWTRYPTPSTDQSDRLISVAAVSSDDVWAAGRILSTTFPPSNTPTLQHWDGVRWSSVDAPQSLIALDALADGTLAGVGIEGTGFGDGDTKTMMACGA